MVFESHLGVDLLTEQSGHDLDGLVAQRDSMHVREAVCRIGRHHEGAMAHVGRTQSQPPPRWSCRHPLPVMSEDPHADPARSSATPQAAQCRLHDLLLRLTSQEPGHDEGRLHPQGIDDLRALVMGTELVVALHLLDVVTGHSPPRDPMWSVVLILEFVGDALDETVDLESSPCGAALGIGLEDFDRGHPCCPLGVRGEISSDGEHDLRWRARF